MAAVVGSIHDSGFAWVVCAASFLVQVILGGFLYTPGMFYIMFKDGLDASDSALSLITSLNICVVFFVCPFMGLLTDRYGERLISLIGVGLSTLALACCSFSTQVYHLHILYGVAAGVGMGMTYNPSISIIAKYFNKYMRVATCILFAGTGVGSFILPPILDSLERNFGWRGAILLMAGLNAQTLMCCCFFRPIPVKPMNNIKGSVEVNGDFDKAGSICKNEKACREKEGCEMRVQLGDSETDSMLLSNGELHLQTHGNEEGKGCKYIFTGNQEDYQSEGCLREKEKENEQQNEVKPNILSLIKNVTFLCLLGLSLFTNFSIGIVGTHFGTYVLTLGYTKADVVTLYMVWGISSTITRLFIGIIAQITQTNIGALHMVASILNGVLTMLLPHATELWLLYVFVVIHQLFSAVYGILNIPCVVESVQSGQASVAIGVSMVFCIPGVAVGPPLATWLYESTLGYSSSFYLSGVLLLMAGLTMVVPAYRIHKHKIGSSRTQLNTQETQIEGST